ncbi:GntR family transcriptional regulator [Haematobacter massiliensis]|uniref:GntR family transcriptional regulator n=1 Tax=Haematobacter massiliensis TaxID=195105 RepID=A0A086Y4V8_9RHOB|nr:GntR family transcriptional regulator [Haematobacter massiliensis]KFI29308.1 GntR family transcriptional regulator [Haematobacter massiliensis]
MTLTLLRSPKTIPEQIADTCGVMIVDGSFAAGQRMVEQQVAEQFGVSRGPVREAFRILQKRRLIDITPRRGAHVLPISLASISDLFNVRMALACLAVRTLGERDREEAALEKIRVRIETLAQIAANEESTHLTFGLGMTRAVHAISQASGNDLVVQLMREMNEQTLWTTIWRKPLDYATPAARERRATQMRTVWDAILTGETLTAESRLRILLEESRDGALARLAATRRFEVG